MTSKFTIKKRISCVFSKSSKNINYYFYFTVKKKFHMYDYLINNILIRILVLCLIEYYNFSHMYCLV